MVPVATAGLRRRRRVVLPSAEGWWLRNEDGTWGGEGGFWECGRCSLTQTAESIFVWKFSHSVDLWHEKEGELKLGELMRRFSFLSLYPFFRGGFSSAETDGRCCLGRKFASHRRHRRPITGSPLSRRFTFGRWVGGVSSRKISLCANNIVQCNWIIWYWFYNQTIDLIQIQTLQTIL